MEPIEGFETSAFRTPTPGNYPKENILHEIELKANNTFFITIQNDFVFVDLKTLSR
jgi:hypothetical protein